MDNVVVVGGGVVGLCCAYFLHEAGARVTVLERTRVGSGASWSNAGWISPAETAPLPAPGMASYAFKSLFHRQGPLRVSPSQLPSLIPWLLRFTAYCNATDYEHGLTALSQLNNDTLSLYRSFAAAGVEFEMHEGGMLHTFLSHEAARKARDAMSAKEAFGYQLPRLLVGEELRSVEPALSSAVEAGFWIQPDLFVVSETVVRGLSTSLRHAGVNILEDSEVVDFEVKGGRATAARTRAASVGADAFVLAIGAWSTKLGRRLGVSIPIRPGKGYSFSVVPTQLPKRPVLFGDAKVVSTPLRDGRLRLAGSMELTGLRPSLSFSRIRAIARITERYLGPIDMTSIANPWVGLRPLSADGLPILDRLPGQRNVYLATGHGMNGMVLGPASGKWLAEFLLEDERPDAIAPFSLDRFAALPIALWRRVTKGYTGNG